jgi:hypothetical protein
MGTGFFFLSGIKRRKPTVYHPHPAGDEVKNEYSYTRWFKYDRDKL